MLLDGTVPTAVFGAMCVATLSSARPMMYRLALEGIGLDTPRGRNVAARWRHRRSATPSA